MSRREATAATPAPQLVPVLGPGQALAALRARNPQRAEAAMKDAAKRIWQTIDIKRNAIRDVLFVAHPTTLEKKAVYANKPLGLWLEQRAMFPDYYAHDAKEAYRLGVTLPTLVREDAEALGAKAPA